MFQRLVVNCASTLLGNDRIAGVKISFFKGLYTDVSHSQRDVATFHVKASMSCGGFEDKRACAFYLCYMSESPHTVFFKCDRRK